MLPNADRYRKNQSEEIIGNTSDIVRCAKMRWLLIAFNTFSGAFRRSPVGSARGSQKAGQSGGGLERRRTFSNAQFNYATLTVASEGFCVQSNNLFLRPLLHGRRGIFIRADGVHSPVWLTCSRTETMRTEAHDKCLLDQESARVFSVVTSPYFVHQSQRISTLCSLLGKKMPFDLSS